MDAIKINRKKRISAIKPFDTILVSEEGGRLLVVFADNVSHKVSVGQDLAFRRYVYGDNDEMYTITQMVRVLEKTTHNGHDAIYAEIPERQELALKAYYNDDITIKRTMEDCTKDYDAYFHDTQGYLMVRVNGEFEVNDWAYYFNVNGEEYFIIEFNERHNIFSQDIYITNHFVEEDYKVTVKNLKGGVIGTLGGIEIPFTGLPFSVTSADTLSCVDVESCGKIDRAGNPYLTSVCTYTNTPSSFSKRKIIFRSAETSQMSGSFFDIGCYLITNGKMFEPIYNPFYFYKMEGTLKRCTLWYDPWWPTYDAKNGNRPLKKIYVNGGNSRTVFGFDDAYWSIPTLSLSSDIYSLGIEEGQEGQYVDDIIDRQIPEVIDMERFKYIPVILSDTGYTRAKSIIFDFHFRKRAETGVVPSRLAENCCSLSEEEGCYPIYDDGWHLDQDSGSTSWWNGMCYNGYKFSPGDFGSFYGLNGKKSDLIGYLGFDDDDVYYRKSKLSMSFIRISFYTSTDPLTQKLLYYSTSFLDATSLYGKYMKQSLYKHGKYGETETTPLVFFPDNSVSARLDTEICIKSEMDNMASSEGFNLYLFGDDAGIRDEGKPYRTIYMKVEFNHAGNGKTIPMIMWPKDENGNFRDLTADTFLNDLYIPVHVGYIDDRFVYSLPTVENENGNLRLILFEPKLGYDDYGDNATVRSTASVVRSGYRGWGDGGGISRVVNSGPYKEQEVVEEDYYDYDEPTYSGDDEPIYDGDDEGGGSGSGSDDTPSTDIIPKGDKRLKFWAYKVDTLYGKRISLPFYLYYPGRRPNGYGTEISGMVTLSSSNESVIRIDKNNYTANSVLYRTCDDHTLPGIVHITKNCFKGYGTTEIKITLKSDPSIYDVCVVNVMPSNYEGVSAEQFGYANLVFPFEIYVGTNSYFDVWSHYENNQIKQYIAISDETAITKIPYYVTDSNNNTTYAGYQLNDGDSACQCFKTNDKTGRYEIQYSSLSGKFNGTYKTIVHVINNI